MTISLSNSNDLNYPSGLFPIFQSEAAAFLTAKIESGRSLGSLLEELGVEFTCDLDDSLENDSLTESYTVSNSRLQVAVLAAMQEATELAAAKELWSEFLDNGYADWAPEEITESIDEIWGLFASNEGKGLAFTMDDIV